jgi:hypothetical protein
LHSNAAIIAAVTSEPTTIDRLRHWHESGAISEAQFGALSALVRGDRFSVFRELNAALYIGVVSVVGGVAWTFQTYFTSLGDLFILTAFSLIVAWCLYYCFSHAVRYAHAEVQSPSMAFDYILYLGCLMLSAELAYIEFRFHLFDGTWDAYLLFTSAAFALLAYRFDNRFVLSLALASFAGWFGLKISAFGFRSADALRRSAVVYGAIVTAAGLVLHHRKIKPHFLDSYLHIAANVVFAAVVSGVADRASGAACLVALIVLAASTIMAGVRFKRFLFVAYGVVYGYIGVTIKVVPNMRHGSGFFAYFVVTGGLVIVALVILARRFGRDE